MLGLVFGSFVGGLYGTKLGRRNSILIGNTALMVVSVLSLIKNYYSILFFRFLFGFFAGFVLPQAPKIIVETVPANLLSYGFGAIPNGFTFLMISLDEALSILNPSVADLTKSDDLVWKLIFLLPIPFCLLANLGFIFIYQNDSPSELI